MKQICRLVCSLLFVALLGMLPFRPSLAVDPPGKFPELPPGPLGEMIQLGEQIVERTTTHPLSKPYVGNALNCTSCHLENGRHPKAATFLEVATAYPAWAPREQKVITLEDRIANCFMRSENGIRPPNGSPVCVAIAAYITWLSTDQPIRMNSEQSLGPLAVKKLSLDSRQANGQRGQMIYARRCADCHGDDGQGIDENPPVWGSQSYNQGAGMMQVSKLAAWLKVSMPLDDVDLTEQEALDVAAFVNGHERSPFILSAHLHPDERPESETAPREK